MIKLRIPIIKLPGKSSLYNDDNALGKETFIKEDTDLNNVSSLNNVIFRVKSYVLTQTKLKRMWKWHHFAGLYEGLKSTEFRGSVITSLGKMVRLRHTRKRDFLNYMNELYDLLRKKKPFYYKKI
jgi:hypothetical protein